MGNEFDSKVCRVLVVDDDPKYAAIIAEKLLDIPKDFLKGNVLEIELSNSAYFVSRKLSECGADTTPWDIIIADVYMPLPSVITSRSVADDEAIEDSYSFNSHEWIFWRYPYSWNSQLDGELQHGGIQIAQALKEARVSNRLKDVKLILVSRRLVGSDRQTLAEFQSQERSWLKYYDKANWEDITEWPPYQMEPSLFQWALLQAINEREKSFWGDAIFDSLDAAADMVASGFSPRMQEVLIEARRLGSNPELSIALLTGAVGSGKKTIARMIHEIRQQTSNRHGEFVLVDCSAVAYPKLSNEVFVSGMNANEGTLFIDELDRLPPHKQGQLFRLLTDKNLKIANTGEHYVWKNSLIIASTSQDLQKLSRAGLFHNELYYFLKNARIHIPSLRDRKEDIIPLAKLAMKKVAPDVTLEDEAENWLLEHEWSGNVRELIEVVTLATMNRLAARLTAADFKRIVIHEAAPQPTADALTEINYGSMAKNVIGVMNVMGDQINVNNSQVGAIGDQAQVNDLKFEQLWNQSNTRIDLALLVNELIKLRTELRKLATEPHHDLAIVGVGEAVEAAKTGKGAKALQALTKAGKWSLDVATKIGVPIAAQAIETALGLD